MKISNSTTVLWVSSSSIHQTAATVLQVWPVPYVQCGVKRIGMVIQTTGNNATAGQVSFNWRATAGSTTNDGSTTLGVIGLLKKPASVNRQGYCIYFRPVEVVLYAGQEISVTLNQEDSDVSQTVDLFIELEDTNENEANNTAMLVTT